MKTCSVEGCERKVHANSFCNAHDRQYRKHGRIVSIQLQMKAKGVKCSVPGCEKESHAKGICNAHYTQIFLHGEILDASLMRVHHGNAPCKVEGCGVIPVKALGYCERHYEQIKKYGEIISAERMCAPRIGEGMRQSAGYIYLHRPDHPRTIMDGYVKRANLVWEENTGHVVVPPEIIHHKNRIRGDDEFDNLQLCKNNSEHMRIHGNDLLKRKEQTCARLSQGL